MKKAILASTSTLFGEDYLAYLKPTLQAHFAGINELIFIPYARPSGISHDTYTEKASVFFRNIGIQVKGVHEFADPAQALREAKAIFTGGGNTFLLVKQLHELDLMDTLKTVIEKGTPYLGCSAGTNIGGVNMQTTNDMPIVYPPSFTTLGLVPFNVNPHYLDAMEGLQHNGETRETRILEFLSQNDIPVVGLREGSWISVNDKQIKLGGTLTARIFKKGEIPYELAVGSEIIL